MKNTSHKLAVLVVLSIFLMTGILSAEPKDKVSDLDREYRHQMASSTCNMIKIRSEFSDALLSLKLENIYSDSKATVELLRAMQNELAEINVPEKYEEPHALFVQSLEAYEKSAANIQKSMGIALGYDEGTEAEAEGFMDKGNQYALRANSYFNESLGHYASIIGDGSKDEILVKNEEKADLACNVSLSARQAKYGS